MRKLFRQIILLFLLLAVSHVFTPTLCRNMAEAAQMRVVYGFDREFPPFSYEDAGGKPVGFDVELMQAIFRNKAVLALRPLNWYNIPLELASGDITVTSGMIKTPQREKTYGFSKLPTFDLKIRFFTKTYRRVPNNSFLRGQMVAVEEGTYQHRLLEQFSGINIKTFKTRALALRALNNDEVDAYCGSDEPSYYYIRKLHYTGITTLGTSLGNAEMRIAVNRDRGDVLRIVNDGLQELIANGEYDRLYRKWFVTELGAKDTEMLVAAAKKEIIYAYAPYGKMNIAAALLTATGKIYTGCNVENADSTLSLSAIRAAVARAVAEGELEFTAAVQVNQNGKITDMHQSDYKVLNEFGNGILVLMSDGSTMMVKQMVEK